MDACRISSGNYSTTTCRFPADLFGDPTEFNLLDGIGVGIFIMKWKASKISSLRTWGLLLIMLGLGLCVFGTIGIIMFGQAGKIIAAIFMVIGLIACLFSMAAYFWVGMVSTNAPVIVCPECGKHTKILGETDRCMYCHTILTWNKDKATEIKSSDAEPSGVPESTESADTPKPRGSSVQS